MPTLLEIYGLGDDTSAAPEPDKRSDFSRGFKEAMLQVPQLGYGLAAGAAAAGESAFGEGGLWSSAKKAAVEGYQRWGDKIEANAKPSDSWTYSWNQAVNEGNFGALVDWLQHGIGYAGGQAAQMLATAGIGSLVGKATLGTAAEKIAAGMVRKELAGLTAAQAGKEEAERLSAEQLAKLATANVASKIGQTAAIGASAFGMEGGEIFGDLSERSVKEGRALSGDELAKAFGSTLAAGSLEFVGDKIGLDVMLGKSRLLKPAEAVTGLPGRAARGAIAAAGAAPIEAGTEYFQTGLEEWGKGTESGMVPWLQSEKAQAGALDAAMLGAVGGATTGGVGGALHGARRPGAQPEPKSDPVAEVLNAPSVDAAAAAAAKAIEQPASAPAESAPVDLPGFDADKALAKLDANRSMLDNAWGRSGGSFGVDDWSALAGSDRADPIADWLREATATANADQAEIARDKAIREQALAPHTPAAPTGDAALPVLPGGRTWEKDLANVSVDAARATEAAQREADLERMPADVEEQRAQEAARQRAGTLDGESPMAAALRKAGVGQPSTPAAATEKAAPEPRVVKREPDMVPMSRAKAEAQAAQTPGSEVVAIRNQSGKLAYTVLPPERAAIRPGDIKTGDGFPYGTRAAALIRARKEGPGFAPVEVPGGFVVRKEDRGNLDRRDAGTADGDQLGSRAAEAVPVEPGELHAGPVLADEQAGSGDGVAPVPQAGGVADDALSAPAHQLTRQQFVDAVRTGRDFKQLGVNPTPLSTLRGASDFDRLDRQARAHHEAEVTMAVARGERVAPQVLADYPTLAKDAARLSSKRDETNAEALAQTKSGSANGAAQQERPASEPAPDQQPAIEAPTQEAGAPPRTLKESAQRRKKRKASADEQATAQESKPDQETPAEQPAPDPAEAKADDTYPAAEQVQRQEDAPASEPAAAESATQEADSKTATPDPFAHYDGKTLSVKVETEAGEATLKMDAGKALREAKQRLEALQALKKCMGAA